MLVIRILTAPHRAHLPRTRPAPPRRTSPESRAPNPDPHHPRTRPPYKKTKRESITTTTHNTPRRPATRNAMAVTTSLIFASRRKKSTKCVSRTGGPHQKNSPDRKKRKNVPWSPSTTTTSKIPGDAKPASVSHPSTTSKKEPPTTPKNALSPFPIRPTTARLRPSAHIMCESCAVPCVNNSESWKTIASRASRYSKILSTTRVVPTTSAPSSQRPQAPLPLFLRRRHRSWLAWLVRWSRAIQQATNIHPRPLLSGGVRRFLRLCRARLLIPYRRKLESGTL